MKKSQLRKLVREATKKALNEQLTGYMCHENVVLLQDCQNNIQGCGGNFTSGIQPNGSGTISMHVQNQPGGFVPGDVGNQFEMIWTPQLPFANPGIGFRGTLCSYSPAVPCTVPPMSNYLNHELSPTTIIDGCIDPTACNYDPLANCDDGSCSGYYGCTDASATNFDPGAGCDDGSCTYPPPVLGCTDPAATNYDPLATQDDGSCIYPPVLGCTDLTAFNYNPLATQDDGSCIPVVLGCTDVTAFNYNSLANTDDGSCIPVILGCMDSTAFNYIQPIGDPLIDVNTDDGSCIPVVLGCTDIIAFNYDSTANTDDGSCEYEGCTDSTANNYDATANVDDNLCEYEGCTDPTATNYSFPNSNPQVTATNDPYDGDPSTGNGGFAIDDGSCIATVLGCTDPNAMNFNPSANVDDGSCTYPACTYVGPNPPTGQILNYLTNGCDPNASYHSWPLDYVTYGPQFIWHGNPIPALPGYMAGATPINTGDPVDAPNSNFLLANQTSYCEWCHDFVQGSSTQFTNFLPHWHDGHGNTGTAISPTGPWNPSSSPTPPESMCCCCPDWGGNQYNPGDIQFNIQPNPNQNPTQEKICCDWCATVDPNKPSIPPRGCEDWNCDDCRKPSLQPTVIPESLKKILQKRAGIIK